QDMKLQGLSGGRPDGKVDVTSLNDGAQFTGVGEQVIQNSRNLNARGDHELVITVPGGRDQLTFQCRSNGILISLYFIGGPVCQMRKLFCRRWRQGRGGECQAAAAAQSTGFVHGNARVVIVTELNPGQVFCLCKDQSVLIDPVGTRTSDGHTVCFNGCAGQLRAAADCENPLAQCLKVPTVVLTAEIFVVTLMHDEMETIAGFPHGNPVPSAIGIADPVSRPRAVPLGSYALGQAVTTGA